MRLLRRSGLDDAAIVLIHRLPQPHLLDLRLRDHEPVRGRRPSFDLRLRDRFLIGEIELSGAGARERYLRVAQESQLICGSKQQDSVLEGGTFCDSKTNSRGLRAVTPLGGDAAHRRRPNLRCTLGRSR